MASPTVRRLPDHSIGHVEEWIRHRTEQNISLCAGAGFRAINERLAELDHEWDVVSVLETAAVVLTLVGLTLGSWVHPLGLALPALVSGVLIQQSMQGWCMPFPMLRRLGVRTQAEIDAERRALKELRGDFRPISGEPASFLDRGRIV